MPQIMARLVKADGVCAEPEARVLDSAVWAIGKVVGYYGALFDDDAGLYPRLVQLLSAHLDGDAAVISNAAWVRKHEPCFAVSAY